MRHPELGRWAAASVVAVVGAVGCGPEPTSTAAGETSLDDSSAATGLDGPVMRHLAAFANEGEDAEVRGVIEIEGECLYVSLGEVGERFPIVWPASTAWDSDAETVILPNGDVISDGDSVYGGGGYRYVPDLVAIAGEDAANQAQECVDNQYGEVAVVNNYTEGIAAGDRPRDDDEPVEEIGVEAAWVVAELMVNGERVEVDPSWPITVTIDGEMIRGTAACNQYTGVIDWSADAGFGRFVVSELSWTEMGCDPEVMQVELSFLTALQAVDSYESADGLYVAKSGAPTNFHLIQPNSDG